MEPEQDEPPLSPHVAAAIAEVVGDEQQQANLRKFLSVNSRMCIPFITMNYFEGVLLAFYVVIGVLSFAYKYNRLVYPTYASSNQRPMQSPNSLC